MNACDPQVQAIEAQELAVEAQLASEREREVLDETVEATYADLTRIAGVLRERSSSETALEPTVLVHEAYLKLARQGRANWTDRAHFLSLASRAMRHILIDQARARSREKRGGTRRARSRLYDDAYMSPAVQQPDRQPSSVRLRVERAVQALGEERPWHARLVVYRFFAGLSVQETATVMEVSPTTVKRGWVVARTWLGAQMTNNDVSSIGR